MSNNKSLDQIIQETVSLLSNSYCPYSKFKVACSILTLDNKVYKGVNVENISYGLTTCAERVAIQNAITSSADMSKVSCVIITTDCSNIISPCGACLQVLHEFLPKNTRIITYAGVSDKCMKRKDYILSELIPFAFKKLN